MLETLGHERILREVEGENGGGPRYEIFHDVLADAVLAWRAERRLERERQEAERKHRRLLAIAVGVPDRARADGGGRGLRADAAQPGAVAGAGGPTRASSMRPRSRASRRIRSRA